MNKTLRYTAAQIDAAIEKVLGLDNVISNLTNNKYDNATLSGNILKFYSNGIEKKSLTLPTSSGDGGSGGGSVDLSNYYTKSEVDSKDTTIKESVTAVDTKAIANTTKINQVTSELDNVKQSKANKTEVYNKIEIDKKIADVVLESGNITIRQLGTGEIIEWGDNTPPPTNKPVQSITLSKSTHTFKVDETVQLSVNFTPSDATNKNVTWSCNNSNATVVNGLVTGRIEGSAIITATTQDGNKTATCNLTIQAKDSISPPLPPTSNINVVYEENGYLCIPVELLNFKEITAYSRPNYKIYQLYNLSITNTNSLVDTSANNDTVFKDIIYFTPTTWSNITNESYLTESYAIRASNYIAFKILVSSLENTNVNEYIKSKIGNVLKFKLKSTVKKISINTESFGSFSTRVATGLSDGQYTKVGYTSVTNSNSLSMCSYGFNMEQSYVFSASIQNLSIKNNFLEILFNPGTLSSITLESLKEFIINNPLTIWI